MDQPCTGRPRLLNTSRPWLSDRRGRRLARTGMRHGLASGTASPCTLAGSASAASSSASSWRTIGLSTMLRIERTPGTSIATPTTSDSLISPGNAVACSSASSMKPCSSSGPSKTSGSVRPRACIVARSWLSTGGASVWAMSNNMRAAASAASALPSRSTSAHSAKYSARTARTSMKSSHRLRDASSALRTVASTASRSAWVFTESMNSTCTRYSPASGTGSKAGCSGGVRRNSRRRRSA